MTIIKIGHCTLPYIKNTQKLISIPISNKKDIYYHTILFNTIKDLIPLLNNNYIIIINKNTYPELYTILKKENYKIYTN